MKRKFKLNNLDCANCAAKMEAAIDKLDGVMNVSVNFMTQSITIEANDYAFEEIMDEAVKICKKIEPDCVIVR